MEGMLINEDGWTQPYPSISIFLARCRNCRKEPIVRRRKEAHLDATAPPPSPFQHIPKPFSDDVPLEVSAQGTG